MVQRIKKKYKPEKHDSSDSSTKSDDDGRGTKTEPLISRDQEPSVIDSLLAPPPRRGRSLGRSKSDIALPHPNGGPPPPKPETEKEKRPLQSASTDSNFPTTSHVSRVDARKSAEMNEDDEGGLEHEFEKSKIVKTEGWETVKTKKVITRPFSKKKQKIKFECTTEKNSQGWPLGTELMINGRPLLPSPFISLWVALSFNTPQIIVRIQNNSTKVVRDLRVYLQTHRIRKSKLPSIA